MNSGVNSLCPMPVQTGQLRRQERPLHAQLRLFYPDQHDGAGSAIEMLRPWSEESGASYERVSHLATAHDIHGGDSLDLLSARGEHNERGGRHFPERCAGVRAQFPERCGIIRRLARDDAVRSRVCVCARRGEGSCLLACCYK